MKKKIFTSGLIIVLTLMSSFSAFAVDSKQLYHRFSLLYSNNQKGEYQPCG